MKDFLRQYYEMYTPKSAISRLILSKNPAPTGIELIFRHKPLIFKDCIAFSLYGEISNFHADFCVDTHIIVM